MNVGDGPGAYRDERASLAAENERLRAELAADRSVARRRWVRIAGGTVLALLDAGAFVRVEHWINAPVDADVYLGLGAMAALLVVNILAVQRLVRGGR